MKNVRIDEDVIEVLKGYGAENNLLYKGQPSVNRSIKQLLMRYGLM